jgi:hypothetical protein
VAILATEKIIDVENVIVVLVVITIIVCGFAGLCKDSAGVGGRFVGELRVASVKGGGYVCSEGLEGLMGGYYERSKRDNKELTAGRDEVKAVRRSLWSRTLRKPAALRIGAGEAGSRDSEGSFVFG